MTVLLALPPQVRPLVFDAARQAELARICQLLEPPLNLWKDSWPLNPTADAVITGWGTPALDDAALDRIPRL